MTKRFWVENCDVAPILILSIDSLSPPPVAADIGETTKFDIDSPRESTADVVTIKLFDLFEASALVTR